MLFALLQGGVIYTAQTEGTFAESNSSVVNFGDGQANAKFYGFQWTTAYDGYLTTLRVETSSSSTTFNCRASLWTDNAGSPGTQIGSYSDTVSINAGAIFTFTFTGSDAAISASTAYWLVFEDTSAGSGLCALRMSANDASYKQGRADTATGISDGSNGSGTDELRCEVNLQAET